MLESIVNTLMQLHFQYTEQFLTALLPMSLTVVLHGQGMRLAALYLRRFGKPASHGSRASLLNIVLIGMVAIMLLTHFIEINAWAMFYFLTHMLPDYRSAMYLSVNSYTTLGASNLTLPGRWQGLDGFEAMTAMLMFGWSTAVMVNVVQKTGSIDDSKTVTDNG
jgi:hypothetical protein